MTTPMPAVAPDHTGTPLSALLDLSGKIAVVTGAANGIGRACAQRLSKAGATVYAADIVYCETPPTDGPSATGTRTISVGLDVTDPASIASLATRLEAEAPSLDVWVNAAGIFPGGSVLDLPLKQWHDVFAVNVDGAVACAQLAGRRMTDQHSGIIINISSTVAYRVNSNAAHYRASKAALLALTQNIAIELGPSGVRALAICPTLTMTEGVTQLGGEAGTEGFQRYGQRLPLGRPGLPDDVARVVLFAASPMAAYMTGSALIVDGGELYR